MEISDLLLLSFVSKNMKKLIKSSQMCRFSRISSVDYSSDPKGNINVYMESKHNWCKQVMRIQKHEEVNNDYFKLNVSGKMMDFRIQERYNDLVAASFHSYDKVSVVESIHTYFLDFFGDSIEYWWRASGHKHVVPQLQNVSASACVLDTNDGTQMRNLENFFSSSPVFKHVELFEKPGPLNPDSKFYQAESVDIVQRGTTVTAILRHFQGRQAVVYCDQCKMLDFKEFVERWRSGEAFQKLEFLEFRTSYDGVNQNRLLNAIRVKHIDATKTPPTHILPKVLAFPGECETTDPIISHTYVVRKSDNRVASVLFERRTFSFGVWDKTEEEFLKMVQ
ncbi:hypothetical protein B9Z55_010980 [Caenorhabditis nigoni]|nr:hypothetical protein B9Z55_010980 [Caenorhabditis nigoni]